VGNIETVHRPRGLATAKIAVYQYEAYDSVTGNYIRSKLPAVRKAIPSQEGTG